MFETKMSKVVAVLVVLVLSGFFGSQIAIHTKEQMDKGVSTLTGQYKEYSPELIERMKKNGFY